MGNVDKMKEINIDNKLATVKYDTDKQSHLQPNPTDCIRCQSKCCTYICPAKVYEWNDDLQELTVNFENCLECGACRIACERQSLNWNYPKGTKGVTFKQS